MYPAGSHVELLMAGKNDQLRDVTHEVDPKKPDWSLGPTRRYTEAARESRKAVKTGTNLVTK